MNLTHLIRHIVDGLWALGGIGAAADLGLEPLEAAWNEPCPCLMCRDQQKAGDAPERNA